MTTSRTSSLLDQNATKMPSPEIAEETSQKDAITISPQTDYGLGMHSKNISGCQTEELDDDSFKNLSDDSNSLLSTSSNKQTIQKNLQPLEIKIPKLSKPPKCEKEKAMCEAKSEKEKPTCETKSNLKRKLENDEEVENKGFNIDGDMT